MLNNFFQKSQSKRHRLLYLIIIVISLVCFWVWLNLSYLSQTDNVNSVISYAPETIFKSNNVNKQLFKGDIVRGEFFSRFPKLGILAVRYKTYYRINDDKLLFRIREKGSPNWYYENIYKTDQFQPDKLFTFGFPIVESSQDKTYEFEIESTTGFIDNAVSVSPDKPIIIAKHKYLYSQLLSDRGQMKTFIYNKIVCLLTDSDFVIHSLLYFLIIVILFIYANLIFVYGRVLTELSIYIYVIANIFGLGQTGDYVFLSVFLIWTILSICFEVSYEPLVGAIITLFGISTALESVDSISWSHKAGAWAYLFLISLIIIIIINREFHIKEK